MKFIRLFAIGMAIGLADLIPGVSGGTIALVAGVYFEALACLNALRKFHLKKIPWSFLFPIGGGIVFAMLIGAKGLAWLLFNPHYCTGINAFFLGLIVGSFALCFHTARMEKVKRPLSLILALCLGGGLAFVLSSLPNMGFSISPLWLVIGGFFAAGAMLLPGVSGSAILVIMGIYPLALKALSTLSASLVSRTLNTEALLLLVFLVLGVVLGIIAFSYVASYLMQKRPATTLAFLAGSMLGGVRPLVPPSFSPTTLVLALLGLALSLLFKWSWKTHTKRPTI